MARTFPTAADLSERITRLARTETREPSGAVSLAFVPGISVWAALKSARDTQLEQGEARVERIEREFVMRKGAGFRVGDQLSYRGEAGSVVSVSEYDHRPQFDRVVTEVTRHLGARA